MNHFPDRIQTVRQDCDLASMSVPWHLKGFTVHNAVTALCICPSNHKNMTVSQRCELSLTGFLALDLFKLVADKLCQEKRGPRGSCFMASQTVLMLQSTALTTVVICCTKEPEWNPWHYGFQRLSEQSIEQHFGHLRCQATNAQLSTRAYWLASARTMMKTNDDLNKSKRARPKDVEPPLSDEQPLALRAGWRVSTGSLDWILMSTKCSAQIH